MTDLDHLDLTHNSAAECLLRLYDERLEIEGFQKGVPRWCAGCGDNAVLTALQRLLRDEGLRPEKTVFVSGIGCSSRLPHYMNTYGFHGIHGRALPVAEGIRVARPDLNVFVNTGDGDSFSIGAAHWIHALRYNMRMVVMVHDNQIYGLTKKQASPTSPLGTKSNTTPRGSYLEGLNPLTVTLGVRNVSFVAQAADWIPEVLFDIFQAAYHHPGLSFIRIVQRCPEWMPDNFEPWLHDPTRVQLLHHEKALSVSSGLGSLYSNRLEHDPSDIHRAREIASQLDPIPIGILYHDPTVPRYDEIIRSETPHSTGAVRDLLEEEFDRYAVMSDAMTDAMTGALEGGGLVD